LGKISPPDVSCGYWTRNTVLVGPTTVATVTSQLVNIKKCAVVFKVDDVINVTFDKKCS
jgi:hypothetical protein